MKNVKRELNRNRFSIGAILRYNDLWLSVYNISGLLVSFSLLFYGYKSQSALNVDWKNTINLWLQNLTLFHNYLLHLIKTLLWRRKLKHFIPLNGKYILSPKPSSRKNCVGETASSVAWNYYNYIVCIIQME